MKAWFHTHRFLACKLPNDFFSTDPLPTDSLLTDSHALRFTRMVSPRAAACGGGLVLARDAAGETAARAMSSAAGVCCWRGRRCGASSDGLDLWVLVDQSDSATDLLRPRLPEWETILEKSKGASDRLFFVDFAAKR